ncbi:NAD(P)-dependent dehydrogenase (short-subunit alcohol dehydrogenase family) [Bradyrhizobium sp. USDA 3240]
MQYEARRCASPRIRQQYFCLAQITSAVLTGHSGRTSADGSASPAHRRSRDAHSANVCPTRAASCSDPRDHGVRLIDHLRVIAGGLLFTVQKAPLVRDGGAIVLISSIAAFKGIPRYTAYNATKASVRSFVRTWTVESEDRGIRINAISPGAIDTPIIDAQSATKEGADAIGESFKAATPLNRLGRPEEIAAAALFLASDESSYVAGADLVVDGGLSAL